MMSVHMNCLSIVLIVLKNLVMLAMTYKSPTITFMIATKLWQNNVLVDLESPIDPILAPWPPIIADILCLVLGLILCWRQTHATALLFWRVNDCQWAPKRFQWCRVWSYGQAKPT